MRIRQAATATLLATALMLGGGSLAAADGSSPPRDIGVFPCEQVENRLAGLHRAQAAQDAHQARLEARLADAQADGAAGRVARLERRLAQLARAQARLDAVVARVEARYDEHCADPGPNE